MLRWLNREWLTGLAAYGDFRALRRLEALERLDRRRRIAEWKALLAMADELGVDRERVWDAILADAFGCYNPPQPARLFPLPPVTRR